MNVDGVDRGLGIIFTHDHYGPSTHQQIGLYATVLAEPAGSRWVHNETGQPLGGRHDGGPTSWQAAIIPPNQAESYREFYFEFSDFQHAYEKGVYVGADEKGIPLPGATPLDRFKGVPGGIANAFRYAINPPARTQIMPLYPDLVREVAGGILPGCPARPCPQAIDVQDPGMFVVNYRAEPVALRVFDPNKLGPDGKRGMQADGIAGDLAYAFASQLTAKDGSVTQINRVIPELNKTEQQLGFWRTTLHAPTATLGGDPFTPMMRAYAGDVVRVKIQAGAHEEEHNATVLGLKWLQAGSAFGKAPNSGWRNSQAAGISEQFTLQIPVLGPTQSKKGDRDYMYNVDSSMDGWWSGTWGLLRTYDAKRGDLFVLPSNTNVKPDRVANRRDFVGVCPAAAPLVKRDVIAILANDLLPALGGATIVPAGSANQHVGGALKPEGGTLVYNPGSSATGPLHDPTAMLYVDARDVEPRSGNVGACKDSKGALGIANASCPIQLKQGRKVEPLILRANAGDCIEVTVYNRLPALAPDLPTLGTLIGVVKRDRLAPEGSVPFDTNLVRPSSHVGIVPQLVAVDAREQLGINVGTNVTQTVSPVDATGKSGKETFRWYAGHLEFNQADSNLVATPIEFGGFGLAPADRVKQGQKSLMGAMSVAPKDATITYDAPASPGSTVPQTRAQATVTANGKSFRDFVLVLAKNLNHRYASGAAVEHMNGEEVGIPEDSQESSAMALNYGIEPLWHRFGILPNAQFGNAGGQFGGIGNASAAYHNDLVGDATR